MPANYEPAPIDVVRTLLSGLDHYFSANDPMRLALGGGTRPGDSDTRTSPVLEGVLPQCVYTIAAETIANADSIASASNRKGWRFLSLSDNEPVAGYVNLDHAGQPSRVMNVLHGVRLQECLVATKSVPDLIRTALKEEIELGFTVRLLRIPSIYVEALWLIPEQGGQQYVVPYRTMLPELAPFSLVKAEAFLAACKAFALSQRTKRAQHVEPDH